MSKGKGRFTKKFEAQMMAEDFRELTMRLEPLNTVERRDFNGAPKEYKAQRFALYGFPGIPRGVFDCLVWTRLIPRAGMGPVKIICGQKKGRYDLAERPQIMIVPISDGETLSCAGMEITELGDSISIVIDDGENRFRASGEVRGRIEPGNGASDFVFNKAHKFYAFLLPECNEEISFLADTIPDLFPVGTPSTTVGRYIDSELYRIAICSGWRKMTRATMVALKKPDESIWQKATTIDRWRDIQLISEATLKMSRGI